MKSSLPRKLLIALGLLGVLYFMAPLVIGKFHTGMWLPSALLLILVGMAAFPKQTKALFAGRFRWLVRFVAAGLVLGVMLMSFLFVLMGLATGRVPPENENVTVLVLGCQVNGDTPSLILQGRIDTAYAYLKDHPEAVCVASGGQGTGEDITEAQAIRDALIHKGIDGSRIYLEDASTNTQENLSFSARLIEENGLPRTVAIASDNFHQLRAALFAKKNDLEPYALGCPSPWTTGPGYWVRESVAAVWAVVLSK